MQNNHLYQSSLKQTLCQVTLLLLLLIPAAQARQSPGVAVASAHELATEAGLQVMAAGGNAFDAAVAVSAALAVVEPAGSGLGGGGFWLLHRDTDGFEVMIDGRERAPLDATENMYVREGLYDKNLSRNGALAAGIPGEPAALEHIAKRYGRLGLAANLAPAIRLARKGFVVDEHMARLLAWRSASFSAEGDALRVLADRKGLPLKAGSILRQPDLARTLETIASKGARAFYQGEIAEKLVEGVNRAGGIWSMEDLAAYQIVERAPVVFEHNGARVVSAAPPSSGGVVMSIAMNITQGFETDNPVDQIHLNVEALRRAYRARALFLGDPDYISMPLRWLMSPAYADGLRNSISPTVSTRSASLGQPSRRFEDGPSTTHFSIMDAQGNRVAATLSINFPFGSGFIPEGTGVLLNNEMDDFSAQANTPNAYGLVGNHANAIAPGKRMLSSMSPTFIETEDRIAILGTPGGSRIISMVMLGMQTFLQGGTAQEIVSRPRYHHQYLPDEIQHEPNAFSPEIAQALQDRGHTLKSVGRQYGNMQAIIWNRANNSIDAATDPRGVGSARVDFAN